MFFKFDYIPLYILMGVEKTLRVPRKKKPKQAIQ